MKNVNKFRCHKCGNSDEAKFLEVEGSIICQGADDEGCGLELVERRPHEGNFYRSFEGEEDRSHHGKPHNPLFSEAHNSRTTCVADGVSMKDGAKIKAAMNKVEEELSSAVREIDDRRTRESYKDKHKTKSFEKMRDVASNLSLHQQVVERASWLFAMFRDDRDKVQRDQLVVAACLVAALREGLNQADEAAEAEDPRVKAERERKFRAEYKRRTEDFERRAEDRKRARESAVEASASRVPLKEWGEEHASAWLRGLVDAWASPGDEVRLDDATMQEVATEAWRTRFLAHLRRDKKTLGQALMLSTPPKLAVCCGGDEAVAAKVAAAVKEEKNQDKVFLEAARSKSQKAKVTKF